VTGTLATLTSGKIAQGKVIFQLTNVGTGNPISVSGTSVFPALTLTIMTDQSGNFSTPLWGNDNINPSNTLYAVTFRDFQGNEIGPVLFSITGPTVNLNSATPVNNVLPPVFSGAGLVGAVLLNPTVGQTISGFPLTLASTTPLSVQGTSVFSGPSLSVNRMENIRYLDSANNAGWTGADAFAWINSAIADLPASGGIVDARGLAANTFTVSTQLNIGSATKPVTLLVDRQTRFIVNVTGGIPAIQVFNASSIIGSGGVGNVSNGGFLLGSSASVSNFITNGDQSGAQEFMFLENLFFQGNSAATCSGPLAYFKRLFVPSGVRNCTFLGAMNVVVAQIEACGVFMWDNNWVNAASGTSGFTGAQAMVVNGSSGPVMIIGGAIEHSTNNLPLLSIDATTGFGAGAGATQNISVLGTYFEAQKVGGETGTGNGIVINNAQNVFIEGILLGGNFQAGGDGIHLQESAGGNLKNITLKNIFSPFTGTSLTNTINDTASGGFAITLTNVNEYVHNAPIYSTGLIQSATHVLTAAAPTVAAAQVGLGSTTAASATAGTNGAVPAQVLGYLIANVGGTAVKIPYFNT
jgi:hypothetical protein